MTNYIPPVQLEVKPGESLRSLICKDKGMIVIGYREIGKSACASKMNSIIDLDCNNFRIDGECDVTWYIIYCRIAVSLARQGYIVLISSQECVISELRKYDPEDKYTVTIICPHYTLKDQWIQRARDCYMQDRSEKNYAKWKDTEDDFIDSIKSMTQDPVFSIIFLNSMDYDLYSIIMYLYRANQSEAHFEPWNKSDKKVISNG